ncbi:MAG: acyl-CoA dehydrogenase family protein [Pseudomonadota bacterium]|nr:acyl-CoA dehydrogenase [Pseudomonadales bacterium]MDY6921386.1 acyl-CoA dehydrogenase family protein [Pseudomonadota bacterium]
MQFTEQHEALRQTVRNVVAKEINPHVEQWESQPPFPARQLFKKLGDLGLLGISKPEQYGGMGLDYSYNLVAGEEFGRAHCGGVPLAIGVQTDMATPALGRFGSEELCRQYLVPAIQGEMVAAIAVSEPGAGSDVANIKTRAVVQGDDYIINGSKMWITNSTQADWFCLLANTSDDARHKNKSLILVPRDAGGISVSSPLDKLGMRSSDTAQVFFDNVKVPRRNLIGMEGQGFMIQMIQFQEERMWGAANAIGGLETVIKATIEYTSEREAFGSRLIDNQVVHFRLAELQTELECLRALVYSTCEQYINGGNQQHLLQLASMCKLKAGRLAREITDSCLQYWGGMGYMWDNLVARSYRDSRLASIGGGADEVMLGIICKTLGIFPSRQ